jgi:hypothetical protein
VLNGIVEFLGWFGAVTVLAGYILFSTGKLPNGPVYQLLNLVGGLAIAVNVGAHHAIPSLIVNGIWAIVAVVVLTKMLRTRRAARRGEAATTGPILVEPPTTTAVLPVVGPALRDHDDTTDHGDTTDHDDTIVTDAGARLHTETYEGARVHTAAGAPTAPAPMTETVPVITATIALALVAAAQREQQDHERQQQDHERQRQGNERKQQDHVPEQPELA